MAGMLYEVVKSTQEERRLSIPTQLVVYGLWRWQFSLTTGKNRNIITAIYVKLLGSANKKTFRAKVLTS